MKRWAWHLACLGSILLLAGLAAVWAMSYRTPLRLGYRVQSGRYTIHCDRGRLRLSGPPRPGPPADEAEARAIATAMMNDELEWNWEPGAEGEFAAFARYVGDSRSLNLVASLPKASAERALLESLETPDSFAAIHYILEIRHGRRCWVAGMDTVHREPHGVVVTLDHLQVTLPFARAEQVDPFMTWTRGACNLDPSQLPHIRDLWHDRLDVQLAAAPLWPALPPPLALLALWLFQQHRQAHRRKLGLCPRCGYDLSATPTLCPECGQTTPSRICRTPA